MVIDTEIEYKTTLSMDQHNMDRLLSELDSIFIDYTQRNNLESILRVVELKNLLTLSVNNARD